MDESKKVYQVCHNRVEKDRVEAISYDSNETFFSCTCAIVVTYSYLCRHCACDDSKSNKVCSKKLWDLRWTLDVRSRNIDILML